MNFFDADRLAGKDLAEIDFLVSQPMCPVRSVTYVSERTQLPKSPGIRGLPKGLTFALGIGFGFALGFTALRYLKRTWSLSATGKQFAILLSGAAWVTIVVFVETGGKSLALRPIGVALGVLIYSMPAIVFGSVGVWWVGKTHAT